MLSHNSISNYYNINFNMAQHHGYSISDLENMLPYEHEIFVTLLVNYIESKAEQERRK